MTTTQFNNLYNQQHPHEETIDCNPDIIFEEDDEIDEELAKIIRDISEKD